MDKTLCFEKIEGADAKYHSKVAFRVPAKKCQNKAILVLYLNVSLARNTTFWQIEGAKAKHDNSFFKL